jgi:hypothetical protein
MRVEGAPARTAGPYDAFSSSRRRLVFSFSRPFGLLSHTNRGVFVPSISQEK